MKEKNRKAFEEDRKEGCKDGSLATDRDDLQLEHID